MEWVCCTHKIKLGSCSGGQEHPEKHVFNIIFNYFNESPKWCPDDVITETVKILTDQPQMQSPTFPGTITPLTEISRNFDKKQRPPQRTKNATVTSQNLRIQ